MRIVESVNASSLLNASHQSQTLTFCFVPPLLDLPATPTFLSEDLNGDGQGQTIAVAPFLGGDAFRNAAHSAARSISSTVAFAAPTAYYFQTTAPAYESSQLACPPGMEGVFGYCCPGVWIDNDCYRTDTNSLEPYTSISFLQPYTKPTNQIKNPFDPNAKLDSSDPNAKSDSSSADLTLPIFGALFASLIGAVFVL